MNKESPFQRYLSDRRPLHIELRKSDFEKPDAGLQPMKLILAVLCSLLSGTLSGKISDYPDTTPDTSNYLNYYRTIATAEEAAVNADYKGAIARYQQAFGKYPYNNPVDCYIAAQLASYIDDTALCSDFLRRGLSFGLPAQTIAGNPHLKGPFQKMVRRTADSCWEVYQGRIDQAARTKMIAIIRYDQSIIHSLPKGEKFYDYSSGASRLTSKYQPVWDSLVNDVISLTRAGGFPAQKIVGTQNGDDSLFKVGPLAIFAVPVFIHHCNAWSPSVGDLLWNELQKGNLTPKMYGVIYEASNGKAGQQNPVDYFASRPCWQSTCRGLVRNHLREIDEARQSIGLEKYEVMEKKFESVVRYRKWRSRGTVPREPFFDFQCDLGFQ
jgi:hypothetical protein